jgi:hypothetical protein
MDDLGRWMRRVLDEVAPPVDPRAVVASVTRSGARRWPIAVGAAAVVVLLVGGGYWLFSGEPNPGVADDTTTTSLESATTTTAAILETLHPSGISCSSELPDFPCSNLIDGDPATEWQAPNGGIDAVITVEFAAPVTISEVKLINIPDDARFMRNGRIREVVTFAPPSLAVIRPDFADSNQPTVGFGHHDWAGVTSLVIEVTRAYPGQSVGDLPPFAELALAELEIVGHPGAPPAGDPTTATTVTLPVPAPITGSWSQTNPDLGGLLVQVRDLIWDGEAFYLLLRVGFGDLIVWRSADGIQWDQYSQIGTSGTTDGPWHLVSAEGRLLIGGRRDLVPTVWIEEGPNSWREVTVAPSGSIRALVHRQGIHVAFGTAPGWDESRPEGPPPARHAVIWASADAVTWSEVAGVELFGDDSRPQALMNGGAGLLAVAARGDFPSESMTFVVAISQDGTDWTVRDTTGLALSQVDATGSGATGYVIVIADGFTGVAYQSSNGTTWSPAFGALPDAGDGVYLSDVEWFRDRIVLSGNVYVDPGGGAFNYSLPAVWVYVGDDRWAPLGTTEWFDQPGYTYRIVTAPDRLIVIGEHGGDDWALFTFVVDEP